MIFMQSKLNMDFCFLGLWFSFYFVRRREQPFMVSFPFLFLSFSLSLFFSFFFLFFLSKNRLLNTQLISVERLESSAMRAQWKKLGKGKKQSVYGRFSRPSCWKEVEREDQASNTNDDDNDVVSVSIFFFFFVPSFFWVYFSIIYFCYHYFFGSYPWWSGLSGSGQKEEYFIHSASWGFAMADSYKLKDIKECQASIKGAINKDASYVTLIFSLKVKSSQ